LEVIGGCVDTQPNERLEEVPDNMSRFEDYPVEHEVDDQDEGDWPVHEEGSEAFVRHAGRVGIVGVLAAIHDPDSGEENREAGLAY